jgi:choline dehydrogenase-like flavoprotein
VGSIPITRSIFDLITMHTHCVIGSGPAGVAAASALLARGARVLMLDAGIELEPDRAEIVRELSSKKPADWPAAQAAVIHGESGANLKGLPHKKLFGSDFLYRESHEKIPWQGNEDALRPSLGLGGLSNVWGATMLPPRDSDISDWPIQRPHLNEHYAAAARIMGLAARHDALEELFPLHAEAVPLKQSRQAALVLGNLEPHRDALRARGWDFGQSRLAVRAADSSRGIGCVYCTHCMAGCVYGCIYNSAYTVRELQQRENFRYERDVIVTRLAEKADGVGIEAFHRRTGSPLSFDARRVYLGAGVIPTARIFLRSQDAFDQPLTLKDSQYFLFPLILKRRVRDVDKEALQTLSQIFIELNHPSISNRSVHLQVYTYSDLIAAAVRRSLGPLKLFSRSVVERLVIVQGYLHSDESASIRMTLKREGQADVLQLDPVLNPETRRTIKRVLRELLKQSRALGGFAVPPMRQIARPGRGFHCGGSIPMRVHPKKFESDCQGRPLGWSRVHVVDASVLPTVPATTITFSVMANAHRIATETVEAG